MTNLIFLCILQAALLARKAEFSAKERCSQERNCVNATVDMALGAVKAEIMKPVTNSV